MLWLFALPLVKPVGQAAGPRRWHRAYALCRRGRRASLRWLPPAGPWFPSSARGPRGGALPDIGYPMGPRSRLVPLGRSGVAVCCVVVQVAWTNTLFDPVPPSSEPRTALAIPYENPHPSDELSLAFCLSPHHIPEAQKTSGRSPHEKKNLKFPAVNIPFSLSFLITHVLPFPFLSYP
ncbi:hypothetical protein FB451DRAFT_131202 [Mycena latifolia]|nr:hypothetical protein FB451DRAFT_131202 [Mycena latifolia]